MNFDSSSPDHDAVPEFDDGYSLLEKYDASVLTGGVRGK
jgi:hypothetical protein